MTNPFSAVYRKVDDWWVAYVEELPGANTPGATLDGARENLRDAVSMVLAANRELAERDLAGAEAVREPPRPHRPPEGPRVPPAPRGRPPLGLRQPGEWADLGGAPPQLLVGHACFGDPKNRAQRLRRGSAGREKPAAEPLGSVPVLTSDVVDHYVNDFLARKISRDLGVPPP